jgi:hypothetical protein
MWAGFRDNDATMRQPDSLSHFRGAAEPNRGRIDQDQPGSPLNRGLESERERPQIVLPYRIVPHPGA